MTFSNRFCNTSITTPIMFPIASKNVSIVGLIEAIMLSTPALNSSLVSYRFFNTAIIPTIKRAIPPIIKTVGLILENNPPIELVTPPMESFKPENIPLIPFPSLKVVKKVFTPFPAFPKAFGIFVKKVGIASSLKIVPAIVAMLARFVILPDKSGKNSFPST